MRASQRARTSTGWPGLQAPPSFGSGMRLDHEHQLAALLVPVDHRRRVLGLGGDEVDARARSARRSRRSASVTGCPSASEPISASGTKKRALIALGGEQRQTGWPAGTHSPTRKKHVGDARVGRRAVPLLLLAPLALAQRLRLRLRQRLGRCLRVAARRQLRDPQRGGELVDLRAGALELRTRIVDARRRDEALRDELLLAREVGGGQRGLRTRLGKLGLRDRDLVGAPALASCRRLARSADSSRAAASSLAVRSLSASSAYSGAPRLTTCPRRTSRLASEPPNGDAT